MFQVTNVNECEELEKVKEVPFLTCLLILCLHVSVENITLTCKLLFYMLLDFRYVVHTYQEVYQLKLFLFLILIISFSNKRVTNNFNNII